MNILQTWQLVLNANYAKKLAHAEKPEASKPSALHILIGYVLPLSLITPVMLSIVVPQHPTIFTDILPGDRLYIVAFALFTLQLITVPLMALIVKYTAEMVDIKPSFRDAFLLVAISATPLWLAALFYLVPSFAFNITVHGVAALLASVLVYLGIQNILGLQRRGARLMLSIAVVSIAAIAFGIILISTLMFWDNVQQLQFAAH